MGLEKAFQIYEEKGEDALRDYLDSPESRVEEQVEDKDKDEDEDEDEDEEHEEEKEKKAA
jgi:hypothetical protein